MHCFRNNNLILTTETLRHREKQKQKRLRRKGEDGEIEKRENKIFFLLPISLYCFPLCLRACANFYNFLYMNELNSKNILIVRIGAVGDVLMATPLVSAIRRAYPDSHIGFFTSHYAMPLLQYNKEIDALYSIKYRKLPFWLSREKQRLTNEMRKKKWDVIFLLESNPIFASLIKKFNAEAVYGFKGETNGYLTDSIPFLPDSHVISNFLKLGSLLGKDFDEFPMKLSWNDAAAEKVKTILNKLPYSYPRIAIHAGFGPSGKRGRKA